MLLPICVPHWPFVIISIVTAQRSKTILHHLTKLHAFMGSVANALRIIEKRCNAFWSIQMCSTMHIKCMELNEYPHKDMAYVHVAPFYHFYLLFSSSYMRLLSAYFYKWWPFFFSQTTGPFLFSPVFVKSLRNFFISGYRDFSQSLISLIITSMPVDQTILLLWLS